MQRGQPVTAYTLKNGENGQEEEEEEEEEGEDESSEEEEEEEPKLKYQRLGDNVKEILEKDTASCMHVCEKFLVIITQWLIVAL